MNEETLINIRKLRPFTRFIYTIGELPSSYLISMTYEEQLIWFCNYLEKTVIPAINNNGQAVEELQDKYMELKEYVDNYFENLDVQEEVNNKLDEMAESGELENLISQYIELATTYVYNNVADMKSATNLVDGSFARTSGFYSYNDGGGALYKVRTITNSDTVDEMTIIALDSDTLVAELLKQDTMNVKQFGAKGDGTTDDSLSVQTALNYNKNIIIKDGTYMIDAEDGVSPVDNSNIKIVNATLKAITNNLTNYKVLYINGVNNVSVEGGTIQGERNTHTGETGQWGHCIHIKDSSNILIKNIILKDAWGDGLYINGGTNITSQNIICDNNRRQGISIIKANNYHSINDEVKNTNGTAPESGIDIEPNTTTDLIKNITIDNLYSHDNNGNGIDIALSELGSSSSTNIIINNPRIVNCTKAISGGYPSGIKGEIIINNLYAYNLKSYGIQLNARYSLGGLTLKIINPHIELFNTLNTTGEAGIGFGGGDSDWGNIIIDSPYIDTANDYQTNSRSIEFGGYTGTPSHNAVNCILKNPVYLFNNVIRLQYGNNIKINDPLEIMTINSFNNGDYVQSLNEVCSIVTNKDNEGDAYCVMRPYTSIGQDTKCIRLSNYAMRVKIPSGHYCKSLSANAGIYIGLKKKYLN